MGLEEKIEPDKCIHWSIARTQRKSELDRGLTKEHTKTYKDAGCYKCDGYNLQCKSYISNYRVYQQIGYKIEDKK